MLVIRDEGRSPSPAVRIRFVVQRRRFGKARGLISVRADVAKIAILVL